MKKNISCLLPILVFFLVSCSVLPSRQEVQDENADNSGMDVPDTQSLAQKPGTFTSLNPSLSFIPAPFPVYADHPGIGLLADEGDDLPGRLTEDERKELSQAFVDEHRAAYYRTGTIYGVLGGDYVHSWSGLEPAVYVQNWESSESYPNSWGLDRLALALYASSLQRVFLVTREHLDIYGKGLGLNGQNGAAGYGVPVSPVYYKDKIIQQRFLYGCIQVDLDGNYRFVPEEPPSMNTEVPDTIAVSDPAVPESIRRAFKAAWLAALDAGQDSVPPLGPLLRIEPDPALFPEQQTPELVYLQSFGPKGYIMMLLQGSMFPDRVLLLASPFLEAFYTKPGQSLPGTGDVKTQVSDDSFLRALQYYGFPLSDPFVDGAALKQRFSKGWMSIPLNAL